MDINATLAEIEKDKKRLAKVTKETITLNARIEKNETAIKQATKDECIAICLDAMIVEAEGLHARHGESAPYTHSYYVNTGNTNLIPHAFCEVVTANTFAELPVALYNYLVNRKGWTYPDFLKLKEESDKLWSQLPTAYTPNFYPANDSNMLHGHHIANGYETDGFDNIAAGKLHGTYSSCTTCSQNDLSSLLVVLKGFCVDGFFRYNGMNSTVKDETLALIKGVYARHGLDNDFDETPASLNEWAKRNPTRCMPYQPCYQPKA